MIASAICALICCAIRPFPGYRRQRRMLGAVKHEHRIGQRLHELVGRLDQIRRLVFGGTEPAEGVPVLLDLGARLCTAS